MPAQDHTRADQPVVVHRPRQVSDKPARIALSAQSSRGPALPRHSTATSPRTAPVAGSTTSRTAADVQETGSGRSQYGPVRSCAEHGSATPSNSRCRSRSTAPEGRAGVHPGYGGAQRPDGDVVGGGVRPALPPPETRPGNAAQSSMKAGSDCAARQVRRGFGNHGAQRRGIAHRRWQEPELVERWRRLPLKSWELLARSPGPRFGARQGEALSLPGDSAIGAGGARAQAVDLPARMLRPAPAAAPPRGQVVGEVREHGAESVKAADRVS